MTWIGNVTRMTHIRYHSLFDQVQKGMLAAGLANLRNLAHGVGMLLFALLDSTASAVCDLELDWMNHEVAEQAIWNVSASAHERQFLASQLDGLDGSFECGAYGNLCDVMTAAQAEAAVEDVLYKAAAGWTLPHLRNLFALHIKAAHPGNFADPGFTQIGHNIAVGWGGASGPLTTTANHFYVYELGSATDVVVGFSPDGEVVSNGDTSVILVLLACPASHHTGNDPNSFGEQAPTKDPGDSGGEDAPVCDDADEPEDCPPE